MGAKKVGKISPLSDLDSATSWSNYYGLDARISTELMTKPFRGEGLGCVAT